MLAKYNLQSLTSQEDIESARNIVLELNGTGLMELGMALGGGNEKDIMRTQMYYLRAMLEQNFIIIRQNERIEKLLEKIAEKE